MAQKTEVKQIVVTYEDGNMYRINEGEVIILAVDAPRRTDICTVFRLNAKGDIDTRQFWMPEESAFYIPTSKAGSPVAIETYGLMIDKLNTLLAARAAAATAAQTTAQGAVNA